MLRARIPAYGDSLVEDHNQAKGLTKGCTAARPKQQMLEAAGQFIQLVPPRDLRPPWLADDFSQALPGEGMLPRLVRPQLLFCPPSRWPPCSATA